MHAHFKLPNDALKTSCYARPVSCMRWHVLWSM